MAKPGASIKKQGNVGEAMKTAAKKVEATYEMPFLSHSPLEPMNFTADVRKDSALLIGSIQFQQLALGMASAITEPQARADHHQDHLPRRRLRPAHRLRLHRAGGGDLEGDRRAGEAGVDARRRHDARLLPPGQPARRCPAALDASGKPVALSLKMSSPSVTSRLFPPLVKDGVDPLMTEAILVPYDIAEPVGRAR